MSLDKIVDDMAAVIGSSLAEIKMSLLVGGRITIEEIRRREVKLPAAFTTCLGTRDGRLVGGKFRTRGLFIVVLAVESRAEVQLLKQDRARGINRLAGRALTTIAKAGAWGNAEVEGPPQNIASTNPYTGKADANNVALWGITWEQDLALAEEPGPALLDDFLTMPTDYQAAVDTGPPIDASDLIKPQE